MNDIEIETKNETESENVTESEIADVDVNVDVDFVENQVDEGISLHVSQKSDKMKTKSKLKSKPLRQLFKSLRKLKYESTDKDSNLRLENLDEKTLKYVDKSQKVRSKMRFPNWHSYLINKRHRARGKDRYKTMNMNTINRICNSNENENENEIQNCVTNKEINIINNAVDSYLLNHDDEDLDQNFNIWTPKIMKKLKLKTKTKIKSNSPGRPKPKSKAKSKCKAKSDSSPSFYIINDNVRYYQKPGKRAKVIFPILTASQKEMQKLDPSLKVSDVGGSWRHSSVSNFSICFNCRNKVPIDKDVCDVCNQPTAEIEMLNKNNELVD